MGGMIMKIIYMGEKQVWLHSQSVVKDPPAPQSADKEGANSICFTPLLFPRITSQGSMVRRSLHPWEKYVLSIGKEVANSLLLLWGKGSCCHCCRKTTRLKQQWQLQMGSVKSLSTDGVPFEGILLRDRNTLKANYTCVQPKRDCTDYSLWALGLFLIIQLSLFS